LRSTPERRPFSRRPTHFDRPDVATCLSKVAPVPFTARRCHAGVWGILLSEYHIRWDRNFVEAWSAWYLPWMNKTAAQLRYRDELRTAIENLEANGHLAAKWTFAGNRPNRTDVENVLVYNVGRQIFRKVATRYLSFEIRSSSVLTPPPVRLSFDPQHYVRYEVIDQIPALSGTELAVCRPVECTLDDLKNEESRYRASLWSKLKPRMSCVDGAKWKQGTPFKVQLIVSAEQHDLNLASIVKPTMDGFTSALHYYHPRGKPNQLDEVSHRIAGLLGRQANECRDLLRDEKSAVLGPWRVPHLLKTKTGKESLMWAPADEYLVRGEIIRRTGSDHNASICGRLIGTATQQI
jgi:hypothetical protein